MMAERALESRNIQEMGKIRVDQEEGGNFRRRRKDLQAGQRAGLPMTLVSGLHSEDRLVKG